MSPLPGPLASPSQLSWHSKREGPLGGGRCWIGPSLNRDAKLPLETWVWGEEVGEMRLLRHFLLTMCLGRKRSKEQGVSLRVGDFPFLLGSILGLQVSKNPQGASHPAFFSSLLNSCRHGKLGTSQPPVSLLSVSSLEVSIGFSWYQGSATP